MGKLFLTFVAAAALAAPVAGFAAPAHRAAHARGVEDPRLFVQQRYAAYLRGTDHIPDPVWAYSPRLAGLFTALDRWQRRHPDEVGLDFDWWISAQDWELSQVSVTAADTAPNARIVTARFHNSDRAEEIRFPFVRIGGRWYLDDAVQGSGHGDNGWTLSYLLAHPGE